jgi:hypothetical protein
MKRGAGLPAPPDLNPKSTTKFKAIKSLYAVKIRAIPIVGWSQRETLSCHNTGT